MNTTPTTFSEKTATYTVVGGALEGSRAGLTAILLNRGGRYQKRAVFERLVKQGFDQILSVETAAERWELEELCALFPSVRFILLDADTTIGERINLAVAESRSPFFLVLWNDLSQLQGGPAARLAERMGQNLLCQVPLIQNSRLEILPTVKAPAAHQKTVRTLSLVPQKEGIPCLYPHESVGIYNRERFTRLGGFDPRIESPYWQLLDFGFRAWLWGETIRSTQNVKLAYDGEAPTENQSTDDGAKLFYMKNLAPVFHAGAASVPLSRFPSYLFRSGSTPLDAWDEFSAGRSWVLENRLRFVKDARAVLDHWESVES